MYTYRNLRTGERRRFVSLQRYPWQLVDDASSDTFDPITASVDSASSTFDWGSSSSTSDDSFSGGGGDFGGGGSDSSW